MAADVLEFCDKVAAKLQSAFDAAGAATTVAREYELEHDLDTLEGLHVGVFPVGYMRDDAASRRENFFAPHVAVVVAERYARGGRPPRDWIDERVTLCERCVFDVLEKIELPDELDGNWVREIHCSVVCNRQFLRENNAFWSEFEGVFRKIRPTRLAGATP